MVSDHDIAKGVESLLRESDPNSITTLNGVVQQLEARLGLDLSHKAGFIRDQIDFLLRSHPQAFPPHAPPQKDVFFLHHQSQFPPTHTPHFPPSHFTLHPHPHPDEISFRQPPPATAQSPPPTQPPAVKPDTFAQNAVTVAPQVPKER